jgi:hypothetical protein
MNRRFDVILIAGCAAVAAAGFVMLQVMAPAQPAPSAAVRSATPAPPAPVPPPSRPVAPPAEPRARAPVAAASAPPNAPPVTGTLRIETDVPGASVFIDRVYMGTTPITVPNVTPGEHRLNVSADGYDGYAENITVAAGPRDITIAFKEVRLNETMTVVHKHGIGSCTGTLTATPQGLRYDTTDRDDAFTAALSDLVTWDVDYLAASLRVKLRNGKTYTFTHADKNADRVLVFHREVEKARRR